MEKSNVQNIAGKSGASYGYTCYHETIYCALVRQLDSYHGVWNNALHQCEGAGFDPPTLAPLLDMVEEARIPVILVSHALVEALANWYLEMKCDPQRFKKLDRKSLFQKWTELPREWAPDYVLPEDGSEDGAIRRDLRQLIARRKGITHHKPEVEVAGEKVHEGDGPTLSQDEHGFILACGTIPRRLIQHLEKFDSATYVGAMRMTLELKEVAALRRIRRERSIPRRDG